MKVSLTFAYLFLIVSTAIAAEPLQMSISNDCLIRSDRVIINSRGTNMLTRANIYNTHIQFKAGESSFKIDSNFTDDIIHSSSREYTYDAKTLSRKRIDTYGITGLTSAYVTSATHERELFIGRLAGMLDTLTEIQLNLEDDENKDASSRAIDCAVERIRSLQHDVFTKVLRQNINIF